MGCFVLQIGGGGGEGRLWEKWATTGVAGSPKDLTSIKRLHRYVLLGFGEEKNNHRKAPSAAKKRGSVSSGDGRIRATALLKERTASHSLDGVGKKRTTKGGKKRLCWKKKNT